MDKLPLSIGIPAFNEEANIAHLLVSILEQEGDNFELKEIIVVSDGSTDATVSHVRMLSDPRIRLVINSRRMGQAYSQNLIFSQAGENVIVLFEADTYIGGKNYLQEMVKLFISDPTVALIHGNLKPLSGKTLVSKILFHQAEAYQKFVMNRPKLLQWFSSGRGGRLFNRAELKNFFWPKNTPEDVYVLLWSKTRNKKTGFCVSAWCYYRPPGNTGDFGKQWQKLLSGPKSLEPYFSKQEIEKVYNSNFSKKLLLFLSFVFTNPIFSIGYIFLKLNLLRILTKPVFTDHWEVGGSTKILTDRTNRKLAMGDMQKKSD